MILLLKKMKTIISKCFSKNVITLKSKKSVRHFTCYSENFSDDSDEPDKEKNWSGLSL